MSGTAAAGTVAKLLLAAGLLAFPAAVVACPVIDVETPVERLAARTPGAVTPDQVAAYRSRIIAPNRALFAPVVLGHFSDAAWSQALRRSLVKARDPDRALMVQQVARGLAAAMRRFSRTFADFRCDFPIYFMDSLGRFDGAGRRVGGKSALVLGIDQITEERQSIPLELFLTHELFHRYHGETAGFSDDPGEHQAIWRTLWAEGLATYASFKMTPSASIDRALLAPPALRERTTPLLRDVSRDLLAHLERANHQTYQAYFTYGSREAVEMGVPSRSGYYVGFLVAQDLGRRRSLPALARLSGVSLKHEIEAALKRLASTAEKGKPSQPRP